MSPAAPREVRLGTRGSALARWQTQYTAQLLRAASPGIVTSEQIISTRGDEIVDLPLPKIGGKGLFTAEIEAALWDGRVDLAVHSLKDLPTGATEGLTVGAVLPRGDARDALVSRDGASLDKLSADASVGTSSRRRAAQLLHCCPGLRIVDLRGNADTRIRRALAADGPYDAIVIACAALDRLGRQAAASHVLPWETLMPAPGQGALALQCRSDREDLLQVLAAVHDVPTALATTAERAFLDGLGGGCAVPIAAYAMLDVTGRLELHGRVSAVDGSEQIDVCESAALASALSPAGRPTAAHATEATAAEQLAAALGRRLADRALADGADRILEALT